MRRTRLFVLIVPLLIAACATAAPTPAPPTGVPGTGGATPVAAASPVPALPTVPACEPVPIVVPTAAPVPRYAQLDETTGLHMTGIVPEDEDLDLATWRLRVDGKVQTPLSLTYDELRCLPRIESTPTLTCPGFFVDVATWAGVPLREVLALAGAPPSGVRVRMYGADGYDQQITIEQALAPATYLAYEWEGEPLPIIHGFPVRVVVPDSNGNVWVKWLNRIEVY